MTCPDHARQTPQKRERLWFSSETSISGWDLIDPHCSYMLYYVLCLVFYFGTIVSFIATIIYFIFFPMKKVPPHVTTATLWVHIKRLSLFRRLASDSSYSDMTERLRILLTSSWMMYEIYSNSAQIYMNHFGVTNNNRAILYMTPASLQVAFLAFILL